MILRTRDVYAWLPVPAGLLWAKPSKASKTCIAMELVSGLWAVLIDHGYRVRTLWGDVLLGHPSWSTSLAAGAAAGLSVWLAWKRRAQVGRFLGIYKDATERIVVADPHGFHMRRCMDLVRVARKYVAYAIYIRSPSGRSKSWANARSLISLQALGVRGPVPGEDPPVVEVRVSGIRPWNVIREMRQVLESAPQKYLSVHELYALAQKNGGELVGKPLPSMELSWRQRTLQVKDRAFQWVRDVLYPASPTSNGPSAASCASTPGQIPNLSPPAAPANDLRSIAGQPVPEPESEAVHRAVAPQMAKLKESLLRAKRDPSRSSARPVNGSAPAT